MLIVMKRSISETDLRQVKQYLVDHDFDFHQSTGANRVILGVIGNTQALDRDAVKTLPGVLEIFKIPDDD